MQECKLLGLLHWVALETLRENMCLLTIPQILLERTTTDIRVENILYGELLKLWFFQYCRMLVFWQMNILFHYQWSEIIYYYWNLFEMFNSSTWNIRQVKNSKFKTFFSYSVWTQSANTHQLGQGLLSQFTVSESD